MAGKEKYVVRHADGRYYSFSDRKNYDGPQFSRDWKNAKQMSAQGAAGCIAMLANPVYHGEVFERVLVSELEAQSREPVTPPDPMTDWQHRNGNIYGVFLITNVGSERPDYPPTVVYVNKANGKWYSRPVADWHRSMTQVQDNDE